MHIYGAQLQAKPGRGPDAAQLVATVRDEAAAATGRAVSAWAVATGAPIGSFAVTARIEGMADLIGLQMQLAVSEAYQEAGARLGEVMAGPAETTLGQVIATAGDPGEPQPVTVATFATVAAGHMADALAWSVEILEHSSKVTGQPGMLATSSAGNFFEVAWLGGFASGAAVDEANAAIMADPDYVTMLDKAAGLFVDGSARRQLLVRLP